MLCDRPRVTTEESGRPRMTRSAYSVQAMTGSVCGI